MGLRPTKVTKNAFGQETTFHRKVALSFVIPSVPGFPTSQLSPAPLMWFSLKRTTCSCPKPQLSTGNPGEPSDLQFRGPFLEMFFDTA
jgi:hypothetical protein